MPVFLKRLPLLQILLIFIAGGASGALWMKLSYPPYIQYARHRWGDGVYEKQLVETAVDAYNDCTGLMTAFRLKEEAFLAEAVIDSTAGCRQVPETQAVPLAPSTQTSTH